MICCIVLKPTHKSKKLLLERSRQREFSEILEAQLRCPVFIFNYTDITYVFFEDVIVVPSALKITADFMITIQATDLRVLDVSDTPDYFWNEVKNKLTSLAISAFEWKHLIISFLMQMDPFNPKKSDVGIDLFEQFRDLIKAEGSSKQQKYFKNKLSILRKRVSLESLLRFLKRD